jgi:hypothetical protein
MTPWPAGPEPLGLSAETEVSGPLTNICALARTHHGCAPRQIGLAESPQLAGVGDGRHGDHELAHGRQSDA